MKFTIEVTRELIDSGKPGCPWACALALAVSKATGLPAEYGEMDIDADGLHVRGLRDFRRASGPLPSMAREFIEMTDNGNATDPFQFGLIVYNWCLPMRPTDPRKP